METPFWLDRWQQGLITGFHLKEVNPQLKRHWPAIGAAPGSRVLVPLCGKSLDLHWLAAQGHRVLGVELSPLAVAQFFSEAGLSPRQHSSPSGEHHVAGPIEIILGNAFTLEAALLAGCDAIYDRAALIALPPDLRARYLDTVYARLPAGCRGLLIALEYPQAERPGPPFSVEQAEVESRFVAPWSGTLLERHDAFVEEPLNGVSALTMASYALRRD